MLSHFPQHPIPAHYVPPKSFLKRSTKKKYDENGNVIEPPHGEEVKMQAFILDTMKNNIYPERGVEFSIFAHSHIRASYVDPISKRLVINAGVIDPERKAPTEKRAFAIYSGKTKDIVFYNVDTGDIITTENTNNRTVTQETIVGLEGCRNLQELFGAL